MAWKCADCGKTHSSNPTRCKSCGCTVLDYQNFATDTGSDRDLTVWIFVALVAAMLALIALVQYGVIG